VRFLIYLLVLLSLGNSTRAEVSAEKPEALVKLYYKQLKKGIEEKTREPKDQFTKVTTPKFRTNRPEEKVTTTLLETFTQHSTYPALLAISLSTKWWEQADRQYLKYLCLILYPKHHFW
jgi:hypothetical protein